MDASAPGNFEFRRQNLLVLVGGLVHELHPQRSRFIEVEPSSRIERDLGIDSLARTELILRIERTFHVHLPAQTVGEAETIEDLIHALELAGPALECATLTPLSSALPAVPAATEARTLTEVLDWHAARHADRLHLTVLQDEATVLGALTYGELAARAKRIAQGLIGRDVAPGDRIAVMLPTSAEFFGAFFGILYAGAIPVPIYPPMRLSQLEDHLRRQTGILHNAGACMLITMLEGRQLAGLLGNLVESLNTVVSVAEIEASAAPTTLPQLKDANAIALIQYTSGSTGDPKGVVLTHANLLANIRAMGTIMDASSADIFVSWLPLYHDMGLIGAWLGCLHYAARLYVMSPLSFLIRPQSWLWAMHRYRATFSASPNFGFELCLAKIADDELKGLDLGSLRMVANGAEPVSVRTLRKFAEGFGCYGFPANAMAPVYGLAESSVGLAFPPFRRAPVIDHVNRDELSIHGIATPAGPGDPMLEIAACGQPLPGHEIRVVDEAGHELGERREGRIEFRGPSATRGYFRNEIKTRELFRGDWLDTGDRGYMAGGDIFVTGRIKDIIIRAGRHLYPQDIEEAVGSVPGVHKGGVAVFGVADAASGTERVVVLVETRETDQAARATLQARAHEVVTDAAGTPPDEIVLAPPRTVPKTSSGKIRRSAARELYQGGRVAPVRRALCWQILRLALAGTGPRLRRFGRLIFESLYAAWWWIVLGAAFVVGCLAVLALPTTKSRWAALRLIGRPALAAMGIPLSLRGLEKIPARGAVLVFNHSSYIDAFVLAAMLPGAPAIVAKRELAQQTVAGPILRRLGTPFVERYDVSGSLTDAVALVALARAGRPLVFFPEGTFTRRAGLSGFYLGAFKVATEAGLPLLPAVIKGTRTVLRSDQWFPRRSGISVEIGDPILPEDADFQSIVRLRDEARQWMLARCGEPDLQELVKPEPSSPS